ncbi:MAG: ABC transporter permease [Longibaculum sp.]
MKCFMTLFKIEQRLSLRCPDGLIFGIGMPVGVLFMIGMITGKTVSQDGYTFLQSAFASLVTVGICATAFMGIPLTIANYREKKILKHFFVTPLSPIFILCIQFCIAVCTAIISAIIVSMCAIFIFGYRMEGNILYFVSAYFLVLISMYSLGMIIASVCPNMKIANVVCTFVYFPMLFLSGATIPFEIFPNMLQKIANILPLTHGVQLLKNISLGIYNQDMIFSIVFLLVMAIIGCIISLKTFRFE